MPLSAQPKSPTPLGAIASSSSRDHNASQIASLSNSTDIPSSADLAFLARVLRERTRLLGRRVENVRSDELDVVSGELSKTEVKRKSLQDVLEASAAAEEQDVRSPNLVRKEIAGTSKPSKSRAGLPASPPPTATTTGSQKTSIGSPAQASDGQRPKIKVKRESEREQRERSIGAGSVTSGTGVTSPGLEADWDEEGPARPGRAYFNKRKRHRANGHRGDSPGEDGASLSDLDSPVPGGSRPPAQHGESSSHSRRESIFSTAGTNASTSLSSHKLKLNPTAQTAVHKRDSLPGGFLRRPSGIRGEDMMQMPLTPFQIQQAAMWELPKRTAETFIPTEPQPRHIRPYPTRPDDVDVDFSSMDWRERDKERDRLEAAAAGSSSIGPGPGQAMVKESAMSRARDRKQDQVAFHTFQQWCDGWFRTLTEEDLAWLSSKAEDMEPFGIPTLGRHYKEVWEDEEARNDQVPTVYLPGAPYSTKPLTNGSIPNRSGSTMLANGTTKGMAPSYLGKPPKFDPRQLKDDHLFSGSLEDVRGGPFTERLLAALLPTPPPSEGEGPPVQQSNGVAPGTGGLVLINGHRGGSAGVSQDMADYEERLMRELKAIDVMGHEETIDWSERTDDEISSTLRKVQRLLRRQIRINELRKTRLFEIAMDRMAYQDYVACLTSVEREIEAGWLRRQTQIRKSMQAQKKKKGGSSSSSTNNASQGAAAAAQASNTTNGAAAVAAAAIGDSAFSTGSPASGTPASTTGGTSMLAQSSTQGFVAENRGGGPIKPQFSESLVGAMEKRRQLQFAFEPMFSERPLAKFTPRGDDSIYKDLDFD